MRTLAGELPTVDPGEGKEDQQLSDAEASSPPFHHLPVMVGAVVSAVAPVPAGLVVDATVGGGGHAAAILRSRPDVALLGLDRDAEAVAAAQATLAAFGDRCELVHARFDRLAELAGVATEHLGVGVSAVLFDLGVSSPQLDRPERGFGFRHDAPLDMRMDRSQALDAAQVVNGYDQNRLARVLAVGGDERFARRIAAAVVAARPIATTGQLAEVVRDAIPAATRRRGPHPARRTFQAIRIEVNDELDLLARALDQAVDVLAPAGRLAVLSYHSGEDRVVKAAIRAGVTGGCTCPPGLPCRCGAMPRLRIVGRTSATPTDAEVAANPRAASARLRIAEKLETD